MPDKCFACDRGASQDPLGEMDLGTMYLRGFIHGVSLGNPEEVIRKLLGTRMLCEMHERRARGILAAMGAGKA